MDFAWTAEERAFAEDVRRFLHAHPPERFPADGMDAGYGSGAHSREFLAALAAEGWLSMCWPKTYGGAERPMFLKLVLMEELALAGAPFGPLPGCWQTADAIIEFGTERLRREILPKIAAGEATFWQGYSEPDAGSDLLALKRVLRQLVDYANTTSVDGQPLARNAVVRRQLAHMATQIAALRAVFYRAACLIRDGVPITYETAVAKVMADETGQRCSQLG